MFGGAAAAAAPPVAAVVDDDEFNFDDEGLGAVGAGGAAGGALDLDDDWGLDGDE